MNAPLLGGGSAGISRTGPSLVKKVTVIVADMIHPLLAAPDGDGAASQVRRAAGEVEQLHPHNA